mgnify:FL=1|tara:strand:+ start:5010 stop:6134 length:1125 start_codon:yes stop_codon:yes gene_type:complete
MIDIKKGDCRDVLKTLDEKSINTCITSPPYYGLRDYQTGTWEGGDPNCTHQRMTKISKDTSTGHRGMFDQGNVVGDVIYKTTCNKCGATRKDKQIGLESTPDEYVQQMVEVFREVRRVLRDDGTVWLNLGDTYSNFKDSKSTSQTLSKGTQSAQANEIDEGLSVSRNPRTLKQAGLKNKDLIGIPWRVALALQSDGWYLRQDIIWHKPNPMPESVKDRCTKSHEYIFLLSKQPNYYYDYEAIKEKAKGERWGGNKPINMNNTKDIDNQFSGLTRERKMLFDERNKRSVWTVNPKPYKEAHFAVFPTELIEPCVLAGCPEGGTVLDPFGGSGTTGLVADRHKRNAVLIELNPDYIDIAGDRLKGDAPLFSDIKLP